MTVIRQERKPSAVIQKDPKFSVQATLGMNLGRIFEFDQYEDASELAHFLLEGQPSGILEVLRSDGVVIWSYEKAYP